MDTPFILKALADGQEHPLSGEQVIGRNASCDIQLLTGQVSREHARITTQADAVLVEDLQSTNGTYVNDKKITAPTAVKPGDVVRFDQVSFSLQRPDQANETIFGRPLDVRSARSDIAIEEEADSNSTVFRQSYVMPPGWSEFDDGQSNVATNAEERKKQALERYIAKSFATLRGTELIALIFSVKDDPPIIKTLATDGNNRRWSIGRGADCDVVVDQPDISQVHAHLTFNAGQWVLEDNQSSNGVWHRRKKQSAVTLADGISLHLASVNLDVRIAHRAD